MGKTQPSKPKHPAKKRGRGRPVSEEPLAVLSIRFDVELMKKLDAWSKANGNLGRSAAIRQAVARLVRDGSIDSAA